MDNNPGLYLIVEFDWAKPLDMEAALAARKLHDVVQGTDWIKEVVAASGGIGGEMQSIWVFWLPNYAALDRLKFDENDPVSQAFGACLGSMPRVREQVKEGVRFV